MGRQTSSAASATSGGEAPTFEDVVGRLREVVERLEQGELPLEESLAMFEEGVRLSREGARRLDEAERRVDELLADDARGTVTTRPLDEKEPGSR